jgi:hypothetical protein
MESIEILREHVAKFTCGKYCLPAIVLNHGRNVTIICCCREFANELQSEIAKIPGKDIGSFRITCIAGDVEFV